MKYRLKVTDVNALEREQQIALGFTFDDDGEVIGEWDECYAKPILELDTFDELHQFIRMYGRVILNKDSIEIYNGYRE